MTLFELLKPSEKIVIREEFAIRRLPVY
jgi:hypothetical protein